MYKTYHRSKRNRFNFTIKNEDLFKTEKLIKNNKIKFKKIIIDEKVSKVSIVGVGMITTPGVTFRMFNALAKKYKYTCYFYVRNQNIVLIDRKI